MKKFEKLVVYDKFHGIDILEIKNIHTEKMYLNLYIFQGFKISDGTAYPVYAKGNLAIFGHLSIETSSNDDAMKLCEAILEICL